MGNTRDDVLFFFLACTWSCFRHLLGYLLLACDRACRPFAGARIRVRALSANRQSAPVTKAAVTAEIHQAFDVHRHFATQIALDHIVVINCLADLDDFVLRQITDAAVLGDPDLVADVLGIGWADAVGVAQRDFDALGGPDIYPGDAGHGILLFDWRQTRDRQRRNSTNL